jgi:hypothetical protein
MPFSGIFSVPAGGKAKTKNEEPRITMLIPAANLNRPQRAPRPITDCAYTFEARAKGQQTWPARRAKRLPDQKQSRRQNPNRRPSLSRNPNRDRA